MSQDLGKRGKGKEGKGGGKEEEKGGGREGRFHRLPAGLSPQTDTVILVVR